MVEFRAPKTWRSGVAVKPTDLNRELRDQIRKLQAEVTVLQNGTGGSVAPGTIVPFVGITIPTGWLLCDGRLYPKASAPDLHPVLGNAYGTATLNDFYLPDFRQKMVRGEIVAIPQTIAGRGFASGSSSPRPTILTSSPMTWVGVVGTPNTNTEALGRSGGHTHNFDISHTHDIPHNHNTDYVNTSHTHGYNSHSHSVGGPSAQRNNGSGTAVSVSQGGHDHGGGLSTGFGSAAGSETFHTSTTTGANESGGASQATGLLELDRAPAHTHGTQSRQHTHNLTHDHGSIDTTPPHIQLNYIIKT